MRILIATDAWYPQVNGVVRTLDSVATCLRACGHTVEVLNAEGRRTFAMPGYAEIRLAFPSQASIGAQIAAFEPDCIHIATEGPIGFAVRRWCVRRSIAFTTGFHTRFAEYLSARLPVPGIERLGFAALRWFHSPSAAVLAPTRSVSDDLAGRGFRNVVTWTRGVDHGRFRRTAEELPEHGPGPVMIYVGRIAVEKGLEDFLAADAPGTKVVIGDGPARKALERKYRDAVFVGYRFGEELVREICAGDVFVFPSKTDTFGLVMLEAMACGLPVAAYPVTGPIDVVEHGVSGWLDDDLATAIAKALELPREAALARAARFTWEETARQFEASLAQIPPGRLTGISAPGRQAA